MHSSKPAAAAAIGAPRRIRATRPRLIEEPESHLDWLLRTMVGAGVVLDGSGTIRRMSPSIGSLLGYTPDDLIASAFSQLVFPPDVAALTALIDALAFGPRGPVECRIRHRDGHWLTVELSVSEIQAHAGGR